MEALLPLSQVPLSPLEGKVMVTSLGSHDSARWSTQDRNVLINSHSRKDRHVCVQSWITCFEDVHQKREP